jgi:CBS domain-containing protein
MQDEVPTCRLDESVGQAGARAEERGYAVSAVVNENGIVLGVIGKRDWNTDPTASVEQLMDPAPTTLRPSDPLEKAKQMLSESDRGAVFVTDSDGRLLGVFFGVNEKKEPGRKQQLADSEGWS